MARQDPAITSFNGGEFSPWLRGRIDVAKYATGCERLLNMIARVQGPAVRRPGTIYAGGAFGADDVFSLPFEANTGSNTVVEVGAHYLRFWDAKTRAQINDNGGSWGPAGPGGAAQLGAPWGLLYNASDATPLLQFAQSNDVMWLTHPTALPQKLSRIAAYKFQLANMGDGHSVPVPFKDIDPLNSITITASAVAGVGFTLTASGAYFTAAMVNEYFYLEQPLTDNVAPWETNKAVVAGNFRKSNGRNYIAGTTGTTGTATPTHSEGSKSDGAVVWTFYDDGFGVVGITSFNSPTSVTVTGAIQLPDSVKSVGTARFARQAWNIDEGYPNAVALFRERLCFARGQTIWCSVSGDYENFQRYQAGGQIALDLALVLTIAAEKNDRVLWLASESRLLAGCASGIWSIGEASVQDAFGPGNASAHRCSSDGANGCSPVKVGEGLIYVQRGGTRLRELIYDIQIDDFGSTDLSEFAEHIPAAVHITQLAYARLPDPIVWCIGAVKDGSGNTLPTPLFAGMTYSRKQQVYAWHAHRLGDSLSTFSQSNIFGTAAPRSIAVVTSPDSVNDDLWIVSARDFQSAGSGNFLEVIGPAMADGVNLVPYTEVTQPQQVAFLDFAGPSSVLIGAGFITPLPWLPQGEIARALVRGAVSEVGTVGPGGLPTTQANPLFDVTAWVGYGYSSDLKPGALLGGSGVGSPGGKLGKVSGFAVRLYLSGSFLYGYSDGGESGQGVARPTLYRQEMRTFVDHMDTAVSLKSGDFLVKPEHGHEMPPRIFLRQDQPLPLNVLAIFPRLVVEDES